MTSISIHSFSPASCFSTADGVTYDLSDDAAVETMVEENLLRYISTIGEAIRAVDPNGLVTIGYFSAEDPDAGRVANDNRWVLPAVVLERGEIDFIDLHAYPGLGGRWDFIAPAFGIDRPVDIPLLLGEFGAFSSTTDDPAEAAAAMVRWQAASCAFGFAGWLVWLWGAPVDDEVITVNSGNGEIATALSPLTRPDPCDTAGYESDNLALDRPVTASREEAPEYSAPNAVDGSAGTWWTADDDPPQWIEIDLETPRAVGRVEILIGSVSAPGPQTHRVLVRRDGEAAPGRVVGSVSADARQGDVLVVRLDPPATDVRFLRVETVEVDGWTILHEVSVYAG